MKKVALLAYGSTGKFALESLITKYQVVSVFVPPEESNLSEIERVAAEKNIEIVKSNKLQVIKDIIEKHHPDAVVISSYNKIIPPSILRLTKFINVHHGDLPRWRGRANINWAIIKGKSSIGLTIHEAIPELDAGNIYKTYNISISENDTVKTVYEKFNAIIKKDLANVVEKVLNDYKGEPQSGQATYCCTRLPEDGYIDWNQSTRNIYNLIKALTKPYDGAFTYFDNQKMIIWNVEIPAKHKIYEGSIPGRIAALYKDYGVEVLTADSSLILKNVHYKGKDINASKVIRSVKNTLGLSLSNMHTIYQEKIKELSNKIALLKKEIKDLKKIN